MICRKKIPGLESNQSTQIQKYLDPIKISDMDPSTITGSGSNQNTRIQIQPKCKDTELNIRIQPYYQDHQGPDSIKIPRTDQNPGSGSNQNTRIQI